MIVKYNIYSSPDLCRGNIRIFRSERDDDIIILVILLEARALALDPAELGGADHGLRLDPGVEAGDALQDPVVTILIRPRTSASKSCIRIASEGS